MKRTILVASAALLPAGILAGCALAGEPKPTTIKLCGKTLKLMPEEEIRECGFPYTDIAPDENAATWYIRGANELCEVEYGDYSVVGNQELHARRHLWDPDLTELGKKLDAARRALELYRKGASKEKCQLPYVQLDRISGGEEPSVGEARPACRLLALEARRLESQKKFGEAVDNYLAAIRIGCHYGNGRVRADQWGGLASIEIASEHAFYGVYRHAYPREQLERFLAELGRRRDELPDFAHAVRTDRALAMWSIGDADRPGPGLGRRSPVWPFRVRGEIHPPPLKRRAIRVLYPERTIKKDLVGLYDRVIKLAKIPYHEPEARRSYREVAGDCESWNLFVWPMWNSLEYQRRATNETKARFDLLRLAVALRIHHEHFGSYPETLSALVEWRIIKKVPTDPFSGQAYGYKVAQGDFTAWSVGEDFEDDGGKIGDEPFGYEAPDLGLTSKLPPEKDYEAEKQQ